MSNPKIFIVDDEKEIADLLGKLLRSRHYDVESFYDANSVLNRTGECHPDILVTDIDMPGMDGISLSAALLQQCRECKIILMSGNPNWRHGQPHQDVASGFDLLMKPFKISQLLNLVASKQDRSSELVA
jgi:two-component system nitrogen regulation response regulator GlnG